MKRTLAIALAVIGLCIPLAGCENVGGDTSREDAHDTKQTNKKPPEVIAFNNRFPNVETKCDGHGHRIFVTSNQNYRPTLIVMPDATCTGGKDTGPAITVGVK